MDGFNLRHLTLAVALSTGMGTAFAATCSHMNCTDNENPESTTQHAADHAQ